MTMLAERALTILHEWVQSDSLRRHCYAVADSLKHFAQRTGADPDLWEAVGLLHDMDYERHPNQEQSPAEGHPFVGVVWLREQGWSEEICRAILSHADYAGVTRETPLERTLYAVDELSGFVMAVARVRPSKSIHEVDVGSVKKKMKDKAFARAVNRDDIVRGATELAMPLEEVIAEVITALQSDAERLGLAGDGGRRSEVGSRRSDSMTTGAAPAVREFMPGDYDQAVALWSAEEGIEICEGDSREEIEEYLKRNPGLSRVAEINGLLVGAALCGHDGRRGWIYHLAVAKSYRGKGVGKLLLGDCVRGLREAGLKRAIILVAGDNPVGHKFWLREGWEDIDGALAMTKEL